MGVPAAAASTAVAIAPTSATTRDGHAHDRVRQAAPQVLRLKRGRADAAPDVVNVELAPAAKRTRAAGAAAALSELSIASAPRGATRGGARTKTVRFRRVDPSASGPRPVIAKARVVDIPVEQLRPAPLQLQGVGQQAAGDGLQRERQRCSGEKGGNADSTESCWKQDPAYLLQSQREPHQLRRRVVQQLERAEFTCNGVVMVREPVTSEISESTDPNMFVYDLYVREEEGESGVPREINDADLSTLAHAADLLEQISSAPTHVACAGAHQLQEAYLFAADIPGIEFWEGSGDSSDELLADAQEDDALSSEGSVDYPNTPEADTYVQEVVSGDENDEVDGDEYGSGDEQCDSDDGDSNRATWRPSSSTLFGYRRHGSDRNSLSVPEDLDLEHDHEEDSCRSD